MSDDVKLNVNGERDSVGNELSINLIIPAYYNSEIVFIENEDDLVDGRDISKNYNGNLDMFLLELDKEYEAKTNNVFEGTTDFTVSMSLQTESSNVNLLSQGDDIQLTIDEDGYLNFKVKDLNVNSKSELTTVVEKAHGTFGTEAYVPTSTETKHVGKINDGKLHHIAAVREVNGMLKIYIDGKLANSSYDENLINQKISGEKVVIADNDFNGIVGSIELRNSSLYYDEAQAAYELFGEEAIIEHNRESWTATACSEMTSSIGDGPASSAIDGNLGSWWHTNYVGGDNHQEKHWVAVDFGEEITFDTINVTSRGKGSNGTIKDYKLEAKIDDQWTVIKEDQFINGTVDSIELGEDVTASAIRITALSTFNGQNFAAIKEITATKKDRLATEDEISEITNLIKKVNVDEYTEATVSRYNKIVEKINSLDKINTVQLKVLKDSLLAAYDGLLEAKELNVLLLEEVNNLDAKDYTVESWQVFANALANAKSVVADVEATKSDVDNALNLLQEAVDKLQKEEQKPEGLFKQHLQIAVEEAEKITEKELSTVVEAVVNEFKNALAEAKEILEDEKITQAEINASFERLSKVMQMLEFHKGDKTQLSDLVERIEALDSSKYIASTWDKMISVLNTAKAVLADVNAMEEEVSKTYQNLMKEFLELRLKPSKEALEDLINKAEGLDSSKYTPASWRNAEIALEEANNVMSNEEASEREISNAESNLKSAIDNLELASNDDNSNNVDKNNTNKLPSSSSKNNTLPKTGGESAVGLFGALSTVLGSVMIKKEKESKK